MSFTTKLAETSRRSPASSARIKEQEIAIDKARDADEYKGYLCYHLDNLGEQYIDLGRLADGLPHYERALRISRELSGAHPESRYHAIELVKRLVALGNVRRHEGVPVAARTVVCRGEIDHGSLARDDHPANPR